MQETVIALCPHNKFRRAFRIPERVLIIRTSFTGFRYDSTVGEPVKKESQTAPAWTLRKVPSLPVEVFSTTVFEAELTTEGLSKQYYIECIIGTLEKRYTTKSRAKNGHKKTVKLAEEYAKQKGCHHGRND